jgi:hypothetical protein
MRKGLFLAVVVLVVLGSASSALACGGLIGPGGAVNLSRTTTLAAHHNGVEHYVTAFKYAGGGGEFGSIVPLPAMPTKVEKGGDWTLQRLRQETEPVADSRLEFASAAGASSEKAEVVYKTKIDALDITVLKGGGESVGIWAADNGFRLPPDAPEVLEFYAERSPYFMAAVFDSASAKERGTSLGDGLPIHITMPMRSPWVPLRILGLGKQATERIEADVYLLTDDVPNLLPAGGSGYTVERLVEASPQLLADLRSDRGMEWLPKSGMTLTHLIINASAPQLRYDLATNLNGGQPSATLAGLVRPKPKPDPTPVKTTPPTPVITAKPLVTPGDDVIAAPEPVAGKRSAWPLAFAAILLPVAALGAFAMTRRRKPM